MGLEAAVVYGWRCGVPYPRNEDFFKRELRIVLLWAVPADQLDLS